MVELYNSVMKKKYDDMCPFDTKEVVVKESTQWFNAEIKSAINARRRKEKKWRQSHTELSRQEYIESRNIVNRIIRRRKYNYFRQKVKEVGCDIKRLYYLSDDLTGNMKKRTFPDGFSDTELANSFLAFFHDKVKNLAHSF